MTDESDDVGETGYEKSRESSEPTYKKLFQPGKGLLPTPTSIPPSLHHQDEGNLSGGGFYSNFYEGEHCLENKEVIVQEIRRKSTYLFHYFLL